MKKFVPLEKMNKKQQREFYKKQRKDWGGLSPVTRTPENPKAYNRAKMKNRPDDLTGNHRDGYFVLIIIFRVFFPRCFQNPLCRFSDGKQRQRP